MALESRCSMLSGYFKLLHDAYERASLTCGGEAIRDYHMCGFPIRLCFANSALLSHITPAFEHLLINDKIDPSLTVCLWDSVSTGVKIPVPPSQVVTHRPHRNLWVGDTKRYKFLYKPESGDLSFLDKSRNEAFYCTHSDSQYPYYERGAPLRLILNWWMGDRGTQLVHAGAVGTENGGVLLVGKGGVGKSTTALTCLNSNLSYVGDDYCMVTNNPIPYAHSLYNSGKLRAEDIERFPDLMPALSNIGRLDTEKALYFFNKHFHQRISNGFAVRAVFIPELSERRKSNIISVSPATGFLALAPSTIFQLRGIKQPIHKAIGAFVRKVPSYKLRLGSDIAGIPGLISDFLSEFDNER